MSVEESSEDVDNVQRDATSSSVEPRIKNGFEGTESTITNASSSCMQGLHGFDESDVVVAAFDANDGEVVITVRRASLSTRIVMLIYFFGELILLE